MDPNCKSVTIKQKIPKDGVGPRGVPECYYTSRVLNSTARYARFVNKLRASEDEHRKGKEAIAAFKKITNYNHLLKHCEDRSLINKVIKRVKLCMETVKDDLEQKRNRLRLLLTAEEEENIRKFVEYAQTGPELIFQERQKRLAYLLAKRQKEFDDKYSQIPLDKCVHVHPCVVKIRAKEAQEVQKYQIREKQMRKMAEREFDNMWHEVAMKEAEALAARMEYDTIQNFRREQENINYNARQIETHKQQRAKEQELLKQEALTLKKQFEDDVKRGLEEDNKRREASIALAQQRKDTIKEHLETVTQHNAKQKIISDAWDQLTVQGITDEKMREEERRQKKKELDQCNDMLLKQKSQLTKLERDNESLINQEGQRRQDAADLKRCQQRMKIRKDTITTAAVVRKQIEEKENNRMKQKTELSEEDEYQRQLSKQLQELVDRRELTAAQANMLHQKDLLCQIDYSKKLKEREIKVKLEESKLALIEAEKYQEEMRKMLCRPFFSDAQHPFMAKMISGLEVDPCVCTGNAEKPSQSK